VARPAADAPRSFCAYLMQLLWNATIAYYLIMRVFLDFDPENPPSGPKTAAADPPPGAAPTFDTFRDHDLSAPSRRRAALPSVAPARSAVRLAAVGRVGARHTAAPLAVPLVPYRSQKEGSWLWVDLWNCLYRDRIVFLSKAVDDELGNQLVATLLYLNSEDKKSPVSLYLNGSGGDVVPILALHDTVRHVDCPVGTVGFGGCMGMMGFLLAMGDKGRRYVLPNTRVMLHHPSGDARGQAADIHRESRELLKQRDYMTALLAEQTGNDYDKIRYDLERNLYMSAEDARDYGVIDQIVRARRGAV